MKKILSIAVSALIMGVIYSRIDLGALGGALAGSDLVWLGVSLGLVVPITMFSAARFRLVFPREARVGFFQANRIVLAGAALNMLLPSKMGDIAKAYFIVDRGRIGASLAVSLVVYEKAGDVLALLLWGLIGMLTAPVPLAGQAAWIAGIVVILTMGTLFLVSRRAGAFFFAAVRMMLPSRLKEKLDAPAAAWHSLVSFLRSHPVYIPRLIAASIALWLLHLVQIWLFTRALNHGAPFMVSLALIPVALMAGLLPLTFAGVGTRDAAFIVLFAPYMPTPAAAALGILCTLRYVMPAAFGAFFMKGMLETTRRAREQRE